MKGEGGVEIGMAKYISTQTAQKNLQKPLPLSFLLYYINDKNPIQLSPAVRNLGNNLTPKIVFIAYNFL